MDNIYQQISTKKENPKIQGWYNTDDGELFWFEQEQVWSCRDERISEEYPSFWYKKFDVQNIIEVSEKLLTETHALYDFCIDRGHLDKRYNRWPAGFINRYCQYRKSN